MNDFIRVDVLDLREPHTFVVAKKMFYAAYVALVDDMRGQNKRQRLVVDIEKSFYVAFIGFPRRAGYHDFVAVAYFQEVVYSCYWFGVVCYVDDAVKAGVASHRYLVDTNIFK